jgi:hypothetical protein
MDPDRQTLRLVQSESDCIKEGEVLYPMPMLPERYIWCKLHVPKPEFRASVAPTEEELREWEDEVD